MPIRVFPPHYQLVYINFDISSFSLISYSLTPYVPSQKRAYFAAEEAPFCGVGQKEGEDAGHRKEECN